MNTPNKLTLSRIILSPIYIIVFLQPNLYCKIAGFVIFLLAAITDVADGHYARKYGIVTGFGKFMDPLADKILVVTAFIALVDLGLVRAWMVALIVGREFYVTGLRSLAAYRGAVIMPSRIAKFKTFLQMSGIIFIMLMVTLDSIFVLYENHQPAFLRFDRQLTYDVVIGIATTATVYTGFDYTVKYYSMLKSILR